MPATKIATCCYCGTRAALVLRGDVRHELACSSCGAPLHEMKRLQPETPGRPKTGRPKTPPHPFDGKEGRQAGHSDPWRDRRRKKKPKKRKSLKRKVLGEIFDIVEDIFD